MYISEVNVFIIEVFNLSIILINVSEKLVVLLLSGQESLN